ncbi:MAG: hypothetical protein FWD14_06330 [Treponema sp.]|nr:hypothetical protein [Treponema sp.]
MKKILLPFVLITCTLFFLSCQRNERMQTFNPQGGSGYTQNETLIRSSISKPGFAMPVSPWFYVIDGADDGTEAVRVRGSAQMALGESIMIGEPRRLTWVNSNNVSSILNFIEVHRENGTEGFALANQVTEGGRLAVVIDDRATLFRTPRTVDVTNTILSRMTVVICYPETESNGFIEVRGWDPVRERYIDPSASFVRTTAISRRDSDIQSSILLQTALIQPANQQVRRNALLESALLDYPDSVFNSEIFDIANPNTSGVIFEEY